MTEREMNDLWQMIANVARVAAVIPLDQVRRLQAMNERAHALGPILDPTTYRNRMADAEVAKELLAAFARFRAEIGPLFQRVAEQRATSTGAAFIQ